MEAECCRKKMQVILDGRGFKDWFEEICRQSANLPVKMKIKSEVLVVVTLAIFLGNLDSVAAAATLDDAFDDHVSDDVSNDDPLKGLPASRPTLTLEEKRKCKEMIGHYKDDIWVGLDVKYDVERVLKKHGGPPGKVNATWADKKDAPVAGNATKVRPLPVADNKYWLYSYTDTDAKTWARGEHGVRRFSGTPRAFLEVRGAVLWTPGDFCGKLRRADYLVDDRGLSFQVSREYCWINNGSTFSCISPGHCASTKGGFESCGAGTGLFASLVGGG